MSWYMSHTISRHLDQLVCPQKIDRLPGNQISNDIYTTRLIEYDLSSELLIILVLNSSVYQQFSSRVRDYIRQLSHLSNTFFMTFHSRFRSAVLISFNWRMWWNHEKTSARTKNQWRWCVNALCHCSISRWHRNQGLFFIYHWLSTYVMTWIGDTALWQLAWVCSQNWEMPIR
jgi:hypothetical protein